MYVLFVMPFRIHLQGCKELAEFKIAANIMQKQLVLLSASTDSMLESQPIKKIDFGSCYYGCNLTSVAILYNASPEKVDYGVLLEEKGVGAEIVNSKGRPKNSE